MKRKQNTPPLIVTGRLIYLKGRKADLIAQSDEVATSFLLEADQPFRILRHGVIECEASVSMRLRIQL